MPIIPIHTSLQFMKNRQINSIMDDVSKIDNKQLYNYKYAIPREQVEIRSDDGQCGSRCLLSLQLSTLSLYLSTSTTSRTSEASYSQIDAGFPAVRLSTLSLWPSWSTTSPSLESWKPKIFRSARPCSRSNCRGKSPLCSKPSMTNNTQ